MTITRRVTFRLCPTRQQEDKLHYWRRLHASLYNAAVYNRKTQYQKFGHSVDYFEQQNCLPAFKEVWTEYKELGSHALQATLKRVDFAFVRFFKGLGGYPRFKATRRATQDGLILVVQVGKRLQTGLMDVWIYQIWVKSKCEDRLEHGASQLLVQSFAFMVNGTPLSRFNANQHGRQVVIL